MINLNDYAHGYILWYEYPEYGIESNSVWTPLQCGAELTGNYREDSLRDNEGDNISKWNQAYSELTGIYWVWRNRKSDYALFNQYRRRWENIIPGFNCKKFFQDYDAMATPCIVPNSVEWQFRHFHSDEMYELMKSTVLEMHPDYEKSWIQHIENSQILYYSNGMMFRWADFDRYCNFLFPILDAIRVKLGWNTPEDIDKPFLFGYISERIYTLWLKHRYTARRIFRNNYKLLENTEL